SGQLAVPEIARENPQPIAALLRLGSVRIKDPQRESRLFGGQRPPENAIGADAKIAMADPFYFLWGQRAWKILWIDDQIIIAQSVVFAELHYGGESAKSAPVSKVIFLATRATRSVSYFPSVPFLLFLPRIVVAVTKRVSG